MSVTPEDVLKLKEPTQNYLCSLEDNTYDVEFLEFKIRDLNNNKIILEIPENENQETEGRSEEIPDENQEAYRCVRYAFPSTFLDIKTVGTSLTFQVGDNPVPNIRMIEKHYFGNTLLKSFDSSSGFCIPGSVNSWEVLYEMPKISSKMKKEMIENPWKTKSDSFYFVEHKLILHNKAEYRYF